MSIIVLYFVVAELISCFVFRFSHNFFYSALVFVLNVNVKVSHYDFSFAFLSRWNCFYVFNKLGY